MITYYCRVNFKVFIKGHTNNYQIVSKYSSLNKYIRRRFTLINADATFNQRKSV